MDRGEQPKKYIRTFAGDIETFQKGGTPDLVPLAEHSTPSERLVAESPLVATKKNPPVSESSPKPLPVPAPRPPVVTPLETYAGDFLDRMKETRASPATVLAVEQDSAPRESRAAPRASSHSNLLYGIAGGVFLIAGIAGGYLAYTYYVTVSAPAELAPSISAPIFVDDREQVSGEGEVLFKAIATSVARPLASGAVRLLYLLDATTTESVFNELHSMAPDIVRRNVQTQGSMAGVIHIGDLQSPFFILSVSSYSNTFSGMLSWEPLIRRDLETLFPPYPILSSTPLATTTAVATTTSKNTAETATSTVPTSRVGAFTDEVISNHDTRVYRDADGRSVILYGYWNQSTLIIARDPDAFTEIVQRIATSRASL